jgi:hypothetical protein
MKKCFNNENLTKLPVTHSVDYFTISIPILVWITILFEICR